MTRKKIVAANWKMNLTLNEAGRFLDAILVQTHIQSEQQEIVFGVPFPYLLMAKAKIKQKKHISLAAQNCYSKKSGAYTGEISAEILKSVGVDYVILGHSERREYFNESNQELTQKINLALENHLKVIFCCGEPLQIREKNEQSNYVEKQIKESLFHLSQEAFSNIIVAYEPIWAIGTGKTASTEQVQEMHSQIRNIFAKQYGDETAQGLSILYGGSVKSNNAKELFACLDVDGGLVGGASLIESEFLNIIKAL